MLQLPLRPLVNLSALALLGWCWYTFRKKRNLCGTGEEESSVSSAARKHSLSENVAVQEDAANGSMLEAEDNAKTKKLSSTTDDLSILSGVSQDTILTSTPVVRHLKGIRPEPEGEVSRAQASLIQAEKQPETEPDKEDDDDVKGHSDLEVESFVQQTTGIVCAKEQEVTNVSEKQSEQVPSPSEGDGLVVEVIDGAREEIMALGGHGGGGILKRKGVMEPSPTPQSRARLQKEIVEESDPSEHRLCDPSSPSLTGKDSGCSTLRPEDGVEAVEETSCTVSESSETPQAVAKINTKPARQKTDASKGVKCVSGESRVASKRATPSRNSPRTLWNVEVPAHLVGRLIGKKGNYISSLKQSSGANIYVSTLPYTYEFQICHLEGSEVQVENALALIRKKFKDLDLSNRLSSLHPAAVHSLPMTSWLLLPQDGTVEVIVPRVEAANYLFVQQHTHPSYYSLRSLTEQMLFCYCHSGCPSLPTPVEAGVLCAAPSPDGAWWRAQVIQHYKDSSIVQIRYVDYGGYVTVDLASLKQIRSDFVTLPFQASEVLLENVAPLPGQGKFSVEAKEALEELTQGIPLIMKVTGSQDGLPLVHIWRHAGEEMFSVNGVLVERGLCSWLDSH